MLSKSKFFISHSLKDITRKRCYFLICLFASFLIALVALISKIVVDQGPVIFLMLAEQKTGQMDIVIKSIPLEQRFIYKDPEYFRTLYSFLNYTKFIDSISSKTDINKISNQTTSRLNFHSAIKICSNCRNFNVELNLIDTNKEKAIQLGRSYPHEKMQPDECIIHNVLYEQLKFNSSEKEERKLYVRSEMGLLLRETLLEVYNDNKTHPYNQNVTRLMEVMETVVFPCRVVHVLNDNYGKFEEENYFKVLMEQEGFLQYISSYLESNVRDMFPDFVQIFGTLKISDYSNQLIVNFENSRVDTYLNNNFNELQLKGVSMSNKIVQSIGEVEHITVDLPVIKRMEPYVYGIIFLGLILKIILLILFTLSLILMHSLLLMTTEMNSFELGILRMLGTTKRSVVTIIVIQCLCISIPGFIMAYLLHFFCLDFISSILSKYTDNGTTLKSEFFSVIYSLAICNLSPLIASIYPIKDALSKNISNAINTSHNKTSAIKIEILSLAEQEKKIFLIFGLLTFINGACIYYFLPLSLISLNLTVLSGIFLWILIGMLCGFIILSMNFENIFQKIFTYIFLFWSNKITKLLILKNLTCHRLRNRRTTLMYSLSVGFFIMITVALNIELSSLKLTYLLNRGAYVTINSNGYSFLNPSKINDSLTLMKESGLIEGYTFASPNLYVLCSQATKNKVINFGKSMDFNVDVIGISPNFFDIGMKEFLKVNEKSDANQKDDYSLGELLYSSENDGRIGMSGIFTWEIDLHLNDEFFLSTEYDDKIMLFNFKSSFLLQSSPTFQMSAVPSTMYQRSTLIPIHIYIDMLNKCRNYFETNPQDLYQYSIDDFPIKTILIKLNNNIDRKEAVRKISDILYDDPRNSINIWYYSKYEEKIDKISNICNLIFNGVNIFVVLICFFNSSATMSINILDQKQEIAIIRSIGLTKKQVFFVYMFESFILIFTATFMGLMVGTLISWTMTLQRIIFTNLPLTFSFPYYQLFAFVVLSVIGSFISSVIPIKTILNKKISSMIKGD